MAVVLHRLFLILASSFSFSAAGVKRWREILLEQAHLRILKWLGDSNLMEECGTREGIKLSMLKEDQMCAGDVVPVTFAEFVVKGARPVDVFNTMLNTQEQKKWNPQAASITFLGDFRDLGARAFAVDFALPIITDRELFQWQVADANFKSEEFWLVFSTENNEKLKALVPIASGAMESSNCLGAYHITNSPEGAHVIITQHVNAHPPFPFPLHQIMNLLPAAWKGVTDFVTELKQRSQYQAGLGWASDRISGPAYMLQDASNASAAAFLAPAMQSAPISTITTSLAPPKWFRNKAIPQWVKKDYTEVRDKVRTWRENHFPPKKAKEYEDDFTMPPEAATTVGPPSSGASPSSPAMKEFPSFKPKAHVNNSTGFVVIALVLLLLGCCLLGCLAFCCVKFSKRKGSLARQSFDEEGDEDDDLDTSISGQE